MSPCIVNIGTDRDFSAAIVVNWSLKNAPDADAAC